MIWVEVVIVGDIFVCQYFFFLSGDFFCCTNERIEYQGIVYDTFIVVYLV